MDKDLSAALKNIRVANGARGGGKWREGVWSMAGGGIPWGGKVVAASVREFGVGGGVISMARMAVVA